MNVCIIGFGKVGQLHYSRLRTMGMKVIVIEKKIKVCRHPFYSSIALVSKELMNNIDIWDICSPTELHVENLLEILKIDSHAKVLVEKPICDINQIDNLVENLLPNYPEAKIVVNSPYKFSKPILLAVDYINNYFKCNKLINIEIEFTKNRIFDELQGRFIDKNVGALGYEWFHVLTILKHFLSKDQFEEYISCHCSNSEYLLGMDDSGYLHSVEEKTSIEKYPSINLYSSVSGDIRYPKREHFNEMKSDKPLLEKKILFGEEIRYRIINLYFESAEITIMFEPQYTMLRNKHIVIIKSKENMKKIEVISDHMSDSLSAAIKILNQEILSDSMHEAVKFQRKVATISKYINQKMGEEI